MVKFFTKGVCLLLLCVVFSKITDAQTITIHNFDIGPYGPGSTITAPFDLQTSGACIDNANVFNLYLSDATGNFASEILIGSNSGFYANFVNGIIPTGVIPGAAYRVRVKATAPVIIGNQSAPFIILPLTGVVANITSAVPISASYPEVFGQCEGVAGAKFYFTNASGSPTTAAFFNEDSKSVESTPAITTNTEFIANPTNYSVIVRTVNAAGTVGTRSYELINNVVNNSFAASGNSSVCLSGSSGLSYSVDITTINGIQHNYPGLTYSVNWGDRTSSVLRFCDIVAAGGRINHLYTRSSCGNSVNGQNNVFQIDLKPVSKYCINVGTPVTGYAKVLAPPLNNFDMAPIACTNVGVAISNTSIVGQDPNSTSTSCDNTNNLYTWLVDGDIKATGKSVNDIFNWTFLTTGSHTVTLRLQNGIAACPTADIQKTICVQDPPTPSFTIPATPVCSSTPLVPVNTSTVATCAPNVYLWHVTGGTVSYAGGTSASSATPQFVFTNPGTYKIQLDIVVEGCGTITTAPQTIIVNAAPVARLSADIALCGIGRNFTFDQTAGATHVDLTGTTNTSPTTYTWTVTSANGGTSSFLSPSTINSQYPEIKFDNYDTYTITVTHTNNCGTATDSQDITFQPAPVVTAGPDQTICEGAVVTLAGSITGPSTTQQWIGGTGTFSPNRNALNAVYTPSAAEISAGQAVLTLRVTTPVAAPCNSIDDVVVIAITRKDNITSPATQVVCNGDNFHYVITSFNPATTFAWTAALTSGTASGFGGSGSGGVINDLINNTNPTTDAVVTYTITPTTAGCPGNVFTLRVSIKALPIITATVANAIICSNQPAGITFTSNQTGTTYAWTSVASAGISGNSTQTVPTGTGSIQDILTNNGTAAGTVTYTITPLNSTCPSAPVTVAVTVLPAPILSVPGADAQICNTPVYTLQGNNPAPGTGKWTLVSAQTGVTFSDDTNPNAVVSGLLPGNIYQFKWTITASATCPPSANVVSITDAAETVGGTLTGAATVCSGNNTGNITLAGQTGNVLRWESSINNGTTWVQIANGTTTLNYLNLIQTTQYRAVVQNSVCSIKTSTVVTITVNPPAVIAAAGNDFTTCNVSSVTLFGNAPTPFAGVWTQTGGPPATIVSPSTAQTQVTGMLGGNIYKFTWTIKGLPPCTDNSDEIVITNTTDVTPSFTADKSQGCGTQLVTFTNTSNALTGTTFVWDFGDGSPQSALVNPQHTFAARTDGKEAIYNVTLNVVANCVPHAAATSTVRVSPAVPIATIIPDDLDGCGAFVLNVPNASPGNNTQYDFYLYRGAVLVQHITKTDKSDATFNAITVNVITSYKLYMVVTDQCGTTARTVDIPITISPATFKPQMFIAGSVNKGCAPLNVTFVNNSSGGDTFSYNIYDVNNVLIETLPAGKADFPYVFATTGTYFVTIKGTDFCTTLESTPKIRVDVFTTPQPDFKPDLTVGCRNLKVSFANLTPRDATTPASSLAYDWDFGDGTHSTDFTPAAHTYHFENSPYTVTLTVTNLASGCTNVITKSNLITVNAPPFPKFTARPGLVTEIPNYHFAFVDQTPGSSVAWNWNFGDRGLSNAQNPEHTYADTGKYKVTLRVTNILGCDSTITRTVQINGVPGQLYMPNAFTPDGLSAELKVFTIKGSGIAKWNFQIYNNWGQLVWQTNKLSSKGEPVDTWDGTFKGAPAPQGVYIWQASATFINGTEWKGMSYNGSLPKRSGAIHLIR